jgi:hypothetical protein
MQFAIEALHRRMRHHAGRYPCVLATLEDAFGDYKAGHMSITAYLEAVCAIDEGFRQRRALWLQLCDWSLVLRWINRAERRAFHETCDALDWCRNWAIRQRGVDITACLQRAGASAEFESGFSLGLAA